MNISNNLKKTIDSNKFACFMLVCILGYALFKRSYREIGDIFQAFLILGTIASLYYNREILLKDKIIHCFAASLFIPILSWLNSISEIPDLAKPSPNITALYTFFTFWPIAYWLKGNTKKITLMLFSFCLGFVFMCQRNSDMVQEITRGLKGIRVDFNIINAQHPALLAGFGLIICIFYFLIFSKRIFNKPSAVSLALLFSTAALCVFFLVITIITQSRQVWLALILSSIVFIPFIYNSFAARPITKKKFILIYLFILLAVFAFTKIDIVEKRIHNEKNAIKNILMLNFDQIKASGSAGIRLNLWKEAVTWIKARPLLGSGYDSRALVISQSKNLPKRIKRDFTHLHNSHIEMLVHYGILGSALIYFVMIYPVILLLKSSRKDIDGYKTLGLIFTVYWMTVNNFESFFFAKNGEIILSIYLGMIYSFKFSSEK
jgi:O-antigen ligase